MKRYKVEKVDENKTIDYGVYDEGDVKLITRGYKFNGLFYERKNSNSIYIVTEVNEYTI